MAPVSFLLLLSLWLIFVTAVSATLNTLTSSGRTRSYWVHPPDEYDESKTYPVVIAFHGSSEIGYDIDGFTFEADIRLSLPAVPTNYSKDVRPYGILFLSARN
jgi:Poly(3-hydroxybutyrate) depolymerase